VFAKNELVDVAENLSQLRGHSPSIPWRTHLELLRQCFVLLFEGLEIVACHNDSRLAGWFFHDRGASRRTTRTAASHRFPLPLYVEQLSPSRLDLLPPLLRIATGDDGTQTDSVDSWDGEIE
jgi:hypothetical protein